MWGGGVENLKLLYLWESGVGIALQTLKTLLKDFFSVNFTSLVT